MISDGVSATRQLVSTASTSINGRPKHLSIIRNPPNTPDLIRMILRATIAMTARDLSLLTYSIRCVYWSLFVVVLVLALSFGRSTAASRKVVLVLGFVLGFASLLSFQAVKWWILRSTLGVGYGNRVELAYACLAVVSGILGYRTFSTFWRYSCLVLVLYGVLILLGILDTCWRMYRAGLDG